MKVLVLGSNGRLGQDICKSIKMNNISEIKLISSTRNDFKVKDLDTIVDFIEKVSPDVIINCIANTNLIHCERNRDYAFSINANFIKYIAIASLNKKITIILERISNPNFHLKVSKFLKNSDSKLSKRK